jgi:glycosyltransferase involved in cell wall biosynthesis
MKASIIIPAYKRPQALKTTLQAVFSQTRKLDDIEIIIIDDSPEGEAEGVVQSIEKKCAIRYVKNPKKGRSQARNEGVKHAKGEIILFIGDDIVASPDWLETHLQFHQEKSGVNDVVIGFTTWYPELPISRYMCWLENGGPLLKFKGLRDGEETDVYHFYTGNISLKKKFLEKEKFNEDFDLYGWEDVELGYRLKKKHNLKIWYAAKAVAYHNHLYQEEDLKKYAKNLGYSAFLFQKIIKDFRVTPNWTKRAIFVIISFLIPLFKRFKKEWYWYALGKREFLKGMREAYKKSQ